MEVTDKILARYVGGQAEIQSMAVSMMLRGEIRSISVKDGVFTINFAWLAQVKDRRWVKVEAVDYGDSTDLFFASNIGPSGGDVGGSDRLCLQNPTKALIVVLFPPDGSKLDRSKVEGFEPVTT